MFHRLGFFTMVEVSPSHISIFESSFLNFANSIEVCSGFSRFPSPVLILEEFLFAIPVWDSIFANSSIRSFGGSFGGSCDVSGP